ncbi:MAG: class I SAM-dependent methyltransferase, partial [Desulfovermiculus sp.]
MEEYQLLIDLYKRTNRQGPGGDAETEKALSLALKDPAQPLKIADIGCGTGASTMVLARLLNAHITAVDFFPEFLDVLEDRAENLSLSQKVTTRCCSMD